MLFESREGSSDEHRRCVESAAFSRSLIGANTGTRVSFLKGRKMRRRQRGYFYTRMYAILRGGRREEKLFRYVGRRNVKKLREFALYKA